MEPVAASITVPASVLAELGLSDGTDGSRTVWRDEHGQFRVSQPRPQFQLKPTVDITQWEEEAAAAAAYTGDAAGGVQMPSHGELQQLFTEARQMKPFRSEEDVMAVSSRAKGYARLDARRVMETTDPARYSHQRGLPDQFKLPQASPLDAVRDVVRPNHISNFRDGRAAAMANARFAQRDQPSDAFISQHRLVVPGENLRFAANLVPHNFVTVDSQPADVALPLRVTPAVAAKTGGLADLHGAQQYAPVQPVELINARTVVAPQAAASAPAPTRLMADTAGADGAVALRTHAHTITQGIRTVAPSTTPVSLGSAAPGALSAPQTTGFRPLATTAPPVAQQIVLPDADPMAAATTVQAPQPRVREAATPGVSAAVPRATAVQAQYGSPVQLSGGPLNVPTATGTMSPQTALLSTGGTAGGYLQQAGAVGVPFAVPAVAQQQQHLYSTAAGGPHLAAQGATVAPHATPMLDRQTLGAAAAAMSRSGAPGAMFKAGDSIAFTRLPGAHTDPQVLLYGKGSDAGPLQSSTDALVSRQAVGAAVPAAMVLQSTAGHTSSGAPLTTGDVRLAPPVGAAVAAQSVLSGSGAASLPLLQSAQTTVQVLAGLPNQQRALPLGSGAVQAFYTGAAYVPVATAGIQPSATVLASHGTTSAFQAAGVRAPVAVPATVQSTGQPTSTYGVVAQSTTKSVSVPAAARGAFSDVRSVEQPASAGMAQATMNKTGRWTTNATSLIPFRDGSVVPTAEQHQLLRPVTHSTEMAHHAVGRVHHTNLGAHMQTPLTASSEAAIAVLPASGTLQTRHTSTIPPPVLPAGSATRVVGGWLADATGGVSRQAVEQRQPLSVRSGAAQGTVAAQMPLGGAGRASAYGGASTPAPMHTGPVMLPTMVGAEHMLPKFQRSMTPGVEEGHT